MATIDLPVTYWRCLITLNGDAFRENSHVTIEFMNNVQTSWFPFRGDGFVFKENHQWLPLAMMHNVPLSGLVSTSGDTNFGWKSYKKTVQPVTLVISQHSGSVTITLHNYHEVTSPMPPTFVHKSLPIKQQRIPSTQRWFEIISTYPTSDPVLAPRLGRWAKDPRQQSTKVVKNRKHNIWTS